MAAKVFRFLPQSHTKHQQLDMYIHISCSKDGVPFDISLLNASGSIQPGTLSALPATMTGTVPSGSLISFPTADIMSLPTSAIGMPILEIDELHITVCNRDGGVFRGQALPPRDAASFRPATAAGGGLANIRSASGLLAKVAEVLSDSSKASGAGYDITVRFHEGLHGTDSMQLRVVYKATILIDIALMRVESSSTAYCEFIDTLLADRDEAYTAISSLHRDTRTLQATAREMRALAEASAKAAGSVESIMIEKMKVLLDSKKTALRNFKEENDSLRTELTRLRDELQAAQREVRSLQTASLAKSIRQEDTASTRPTRKTSSAPQRAPSRRSSTVGPPARLPIQVERQPSVSSRGPPTDDEIDLDLEEHNPDDDDRSTDLGEETDLEEVETSKPVTKPTETTARGRTTTAAGAGGKRKRFAHDPLADMDV